MIKGKQFSSNKISLALRGKLMVFTITLVVILSLVQLTISYLLATNGGKLRQLEEKASLLEEQNKILLEEVNQMRSLTRINKEAQNLGLVKAKSILHLTPQVPVALETEKLSGVR